MIELVITDKQWYKIVRNLPPSDDLSIVYSQRMAEDCGTPVHFISSYQYDNYVKLGFNTEEDKLIFQMKFL